MSEILLPMFPCKVFRVLWLILTDLIHFEFTLVYGIRKWCIFIFFPCICPFFLTPCIEETCLHLTVYSGFFCQILFGHISLHFLFCSNFLHVYSYASTRLFWLQWSCSIVWYQVEWFLQLCSSFSRLVWLCGVFCGSI